MTDKLNARQRKFIDEYLLTLNATRAAVNAGYSEDTARQQGSRLLTNVDIKAGIEARLNEHAMSANEVIARLAQQGRSDINDVLDEDGNINIRKAREAGKTHLIKKLKRRLTTTEDGDTTEQIEIELHDAQAALVHLGRYHALFTDKSEQSGELTVKVIRSGGNPGYAPKSLPKPD